MPQLIALAIVIMVVITHWYIVIPVIVVAGFLWYQYDKDVQEQSMEKEHKEIQYYKEHARIERENLIRHTKISEMDGETFELYICELFRLDGYSAEHLGHQKGHMGGVDILLNGNIPVECKNHISPVGIGIIRQLYGVMMDQSFDSGIAVCPSGFTKDSITFASRNNIKLLDISDIKRMSKLYKLNKKPVVDAIQKCQKRIEMGAHSEDDRQFLIKSCMEHMKVSEEDATAAIDSAIEDARKKRKIVYRTR